jgi:hypothetical protein
MERVAAEGLSQENPISAGAVRLAAVYIALL